MVDLGDLKVKLGVKFDDTEARRAQQTLRNIARDIPDPKLSLDKRQFDQGINAVKQTVNDLERRQAVTRVTAQIDQAEAELHTLRAELDRLTGTPEVVRVRADVDQATQELSAFKRVLTEVGSVAAGFTLAEAVQEGAQQVVAFTRDAITAASDLVENVNKVTVVFGQSTDEIREWADGSARAFGLSEAAALGAVGTFGNLFTSMEIGRSTALEMSTGIVQLAADLGSFNNLGTPEVLEKIRAGLVGEIEPLRSLGVNLTAATIEAKALEMGLSRTGQELTAGAKAQAAYALILEQTTNAQGDFARTADGAANSVKIAQASIDDMKASLGAGVLPLVPLFADAVTDASESVIFLTGAVGQLSDALLGNEDAFARATQKAREWSDEVRDGGLAVAQFGVDIATGTIDYLWNFGEATDESTEGLFDWIKMVRDAATATVEFRDLLLDVTGILSDLTKESDAGGAALDKYGGAHARAAEYAGLANERNSAFFHTLELGSGAVAEAAFALDKLNEAAAAGVQGHINLDTQFNQATSTIDGYEESISQTETALEILKGEIEENGSLTAEQQQKYDTLTWALDRYKGGIEDSEGAVVDAAVANAEYTRKLDELNAEFDGGKENPAEYARRMAELVAETDPATASTFNMAAAQGDLMTAFDATLNKLGNMLIDLGLLPESKRTEFQTPGLDDANAGVDDLGSSIDGLPDGKTITVVTNFVTNGAPFGGGTGFTEYAEGGIVDGPTLALIGEAGPELVLPLSKPERMKTLLAQAGIPAWADGGGVMPGVGSYGGPKTGGAGVTLDVRVNVEPIDFSFLFAGLDREAEDWGEQAGKTFIGFFSGNIVDLATGDLLADAQAALDELFTIRQIAMDAGVTGDVIMQINQEIQAQQAEVAAIGAAMGTPIVQGIADALAAGEVSALLADFREEIITGLNLDSILDDQESLNHALSEMIVLQQAASELGDTETADRMAEEIARLTAEIALSNQVIGTDAVQAWIDWQAQVEAADQAAQDALETAQAWAATFQGISNPGGLDQLQDGYRDAQIALQTAMVDPTTDPETLRVLQEQYDAALAALKRYEDGLQTAIENGVFTQEELLEQARQGGETLRMILESGTLSDAQIRELVESGDEAVRGILEAFFGENTIAAWEDGWDNISEADYAALLAMEPKGEEMSDQWVSGVLTGLQNGRLSVAQAMELLTDEAGEISDEAAQSLLDTWRQVGADLDQAMATGENLDEARLAYDQFMVFLEELALASGMTVEEIIAHFEKIEAAALQTESALTGSSIAFGQAPPGDQASFDALIDLHDDTAARIGDAYEQMRERIRDINRQLRDETAQILGDLHDQLARLDDALTSDATGGAVADALLHGTRSLDEIQAVVGSLDGDELAATMEQLLATRDQLAEEVLRGDLGLSADPNAAKNLANVEAIIGQLRPQYEADLHASADAAIAAARRSAQEAIDAAREQAAEAARQIQEAALESAQEIVLALVAAGVTNIEAIQTGLGLDDAQFADFLAEMEARGVDIAAILATSLADEAKNQEGRLHEAGRSAGLAMAQGTRDALGIASPSQVYHDIGVDTFDGLMLAFEEERERPIEFWAGLHATLLGLHAEQVPLWYESGLALDTGLAQGILDGESAVIDAAIRVARAAIAAAKDELGIASPSRVFHEIGEFTAEGFLQGAEDGLSALGEWEMFDLPEVADISNRVRAFTQDVSSYLAPMASSIAATQRPAGALVGEDAPVIETHLTIELDGAVVARSVNRTNSQAGRMSAGLVG